MSHGEIHRSSRVGWLRAAVLGANDGIVSTASLIIGVAAASTTQSNILIAGVAGLVAGAMSMAAGEYVSVSSQSDTEAADLELEKAALVTDYAFEVDELAKIYENRGLDSQLAHDALEAHARDEIGISSQGGARPIQAALYSAGTFTIGAAMPLSVAWLAPESLLIALVSVFSLVFLTLLGGLAAQAGGASISTGALRVTFWGALAMLMTAAVGRLFGVVA